MYTYIYMYGWVITCARLTRAFHFADLCILVWCNINPPLREGKNGRGGVRKSSIFSLGDDTIPGDGQVKKFSSTSPPPFFSSAKKTKILKTLGTREKNMKISENAKYTSKNCCRT